MVVVESVSNFFIRIDRRTINDGYTNNLCFTIKKILGQLAHLGNSATGRQGFVKTTNTIWKNMLFKNKIYLQLSPKQQQRHLPFLLFLYFSYGSYILQDIVYLLDNFLALARFQVNQRTLGKNRGGCVPHFLISKL